MSRIWGATALEGFIAFEMARQLRQRSEVVWTCMFIVEYILQSNSATFQIRDLLTRNATLLFFADWWFHASLLRLASMEKIAISF